MAICVPPAAPHVAITIRRFGNRALTVEQLVAQGALPQPVSETARSLLRSRSNILVSGGTGSGKTTLLNALVKHALRHRPDHIVVGEVRGGEAVDLLQALNTGHGGSLTTVHANNALSALSRIAACAMQGETDLPWEVTCRGVVDGISMVIHMTRRDGRRFTEEALLVRNYDADKDSWQTDPVWPVKHDKDMEPC